MLSILLFFVIKENMCCLEMKANKHILDLTKIYLDFFLSFLFSSLLSVADCPPAKQNLYITCCFLENKNDWTII